jgi:hypothetical protein
MIVNSPLPAAQNPDPVIARLSAIEDSNARIEEMARSLYKIMISKPASTSLPALSPISSEDRKQAVGATFFREKNKLLTNQDSRLCDAVFSLHSIPQIS